MSIQTDLTRRDEATTGLSLVCTMPRSWELRWSSQKPVLWRGSKSIDESRRRTYSANMNELHLLHHSKEPHHLQLSAIVGDVYYVHGGIVGR